MHNTCNHMFTDMFLLSEVFINNLDCVCTVYVGSCVVKSDVIIICIVTGVHKRSPFQGVAKLSKSLFSAIILFYKLTGYLWKV